MLVGLSERTNEEGARQLGEVLLPHGYRTEPVEVEAGLHLKSSVNVVADAALVVVAGLRTFEPIQRYTLLVLDEGEEPAANVLRVNDRLLVPAGYPLATTMFRSLGVTIVEVDVSEMQKMDGGLTCLSLRL